MDKVLAAVVTATFTLGSALVFGADVVKKTELTQDERTEMRVRADKLIGERTGTPVALKTQELTQEERTELRNRAAKLTAQRAAVSVPTKSTVEKRHLNQHKKTPDSKAKQAQPKA